MTFSNYFRTFVVIISMSSFGCPQKACALIITEKWAAVGYAVKYEKSTNDRDVKMTGMPEIQIGVAAAKWAVTLQINQSNQSDNIGSLAISTTSFQSVVALQYSLFEGEESRWDPYLFIGTGVFQYKVTTAMGSIESTSYGEWNTLAKFGGGIWFFPAPDWRVAVEIRESYSKNFNPEMVPELNFKLGRSF